MKPSALPLICAFVLLALSALTAPTAAQSDLGSFGLALQQVDLNVDSVRFDEDEMACWGGDRWRLSWFTLLHRNPFRMPLHGAIIMEGLSKDTLNPSALLASACRYVDHPIRRGLIGDQLASYTTFPDSLPRPSITRNKGFLSGEEYNPLKDRIDLIYAIANDKRFALKRAIDEAATKGNRKKLFSYFVHEDTTVLDDVYKILSLVDFDRLYAGAQDIVEAARRIAVPSDSLAFPPVKLEFDSPRGKIVVGSAGDDTFEYFTPPLLIIDGGGNDTYRFGGYPEDYPASVIVDFGGNDTYISTDTTEPGIGGAVLSVSVLIDLAGDDRYDGRNLCQGAAVFGVSVLVDQNGRDTYSARLMAQGAGAFGAGILYDQNGDDSLYCFGAAQGYGYTRGCGMLINVTGDDRYVAEDDSLFSPSSQTPEHNSSLAQGVGFGKRADFDNGHSWAGGVGLLADCSGNDRYSAGLFAQGCGYWFAVGMLLDGAGDDVYNGVWYVQGSGAHFAVGYLDDFGGSDRYTATHNMADGAGHDFTVGFLNERAGNDSYTVPNLSLGGGNADGIGIFWEHGGNDTYTTKGGTTLGMANASSGGIRQYLRAIGLFVDEDGEDTYVGREISNNSLWTQTERHRPTANIGVGIDRSPNSEPAEAPMRPEGGE